MTATYRTSNHHDHDAQRALFHVDVEPERDVVRICPAGEVDLATVGVVRERVADVTSAGFRRVVIDLRQVTFLDSTGLRLLLELNAASQSDGWELGVIQGSAEVQQRDDDAFARDATPAFGQVPEQRDEAAVDRVDLRDRLGGGEAGPAGASPVDQHGVDFGKPWKCVPECATKDGEAGVGEDVPAGLLLEELWLALSRPWPESGSRSSNAAVRVRDLAAAPELRGLASGSTATPATSSS
jgi:anti-sigma B factor antagonist